MKLPPPGRAPIKIIAHGPDYDWAQVERITGRLNGSDFLHARGFGPAVADFPLGQTSLVAAIAEVLRRPEGDRWRTIQLLRALHRYRQQPHQFIWDEVELRWRLVDWE